MIRYYSKATGGFYSDAPGTAKLPPDAKPETVWSDTYANIVTNRPPAKIIIADANGCPVLADPPGPGTAVLWAAYQAAAQAALTASDRVILRCYEDAVAVPAAWADYRKALRAIVSASTGDPTQPLPTAPSVPADA